MKIFSSIWRFFTTFECGGCNEILPNSEKLGGMFGCCNACWRKTCKESDEYQREKRIGEMEEAIRRAAKPKGEDKVST